MHGTQAQDTAGPEDVRGGEPAGPVGWHLVPTAEKAADHTIDIVVDVAALRICTMKLHQPLTVGGFGVGHADLDRLAAKATKAIARYDPSKSIAKSLTRAWRVGSGT
jgi:hypothetical protein